MLRVTVCSEFFCDPALWMRFAAETLPALIRPRRRFRALCCGCGPGLEPFGLAILLHDIGAPDWHIRAFDTDQKAIEVARAGGPFRPLDLRNVIEAERPRYFTEIDGRPFVRPDLHDGIDFFVGDVRTTSLGTGLDLILYRNVEPFFSPAENFTVLTRLGAALRLGGALFISSVDRAEGAEATGLSRLGAGILVRTSAIPMPRPHYGETN